MDDPLTPEEKQILLNNGWAFATDDYIYVPDDYDGQMANGIKNIRRVIDGIKRRNQPRMDNVWLKRRDYRIDRKYGSPPSQHDPIPLRTVVHFGFQL